MRPVQSITILALLLALTACEDGPPWGGRGAPTDQEIAPDYGPMAAYNRHLIFLGAGTDLPTAAVYDFVALSDSIGVRRGVRSRVVDADRWRTLVDAGWEMQPMREPWRLVPHGPLKLTVTETGDLGALIHRDSVATRLDLGATLAEHSPDVSTQLVLRSARLSVDDATVSGVLLDIQLGRAVNPQMVQRDAADTTQTAADSAVAVPPTPVARPGAEALLLNSSGYHAVLANVATGSLAWIRSADQDDIRSGARIEPAAWSLDERSGAELPSAWRIVSTDNALRGELTTRSVDPIVVEGVGGPDALAYVLVSGWIEDRSARRDVFGLIRHVW